MKLTKVFDRTLQSYIEGKRIISNVGSTRSGKTYSILQLIYLIALKKKVHISIVSESIPHLKRGCIKDFKEIVTEGIINYNKTDRIYTFVSGATVEFFSIDNAAKLRGAQRDILFINEANLIPYEAYRQLAIRTSRTIFLDYNPSNPFWIDELKGRDDFVEYRSTYKDNDFLSPEQIREIESNKSDERWWRIFGLGLEANSDGLIYPDYELFLNAPNGTTIYGLDFGWTDPTALVKVTVDYDTIYVEELLYESKLTSQQIYESIKPIVGKDLIVADNARPEIIMDLKRKGINIIPCKKGPNSIVAGIQFVKSYKIRIKGKNILDEIRNYSYGRKDDKFTDEPVGGKDHLLDAMRYAVCHNMRKPSGNYNIKLI